MSQIPNCPTCHWFNDLLTPWCDNRCGPVPADHRCQEWEERKVVIKDPPEWERIKKQTGAWWG